MIKTKIIPIIMMLAVSAYAAESQDKINEKMKKTAEALGVSVYEEFPSTNFSYSQDNPQPVLDGTFVPSAKNFTVPENLNNGIKPVAPSLSFSEKTSVYLSYASTIFNAISAQLSDSGVFSSGAPNFDEISKNLLARTASSTYPSRKAKETSLFKEGGFLSEFEKIAGSRFVSGNSAKYLIDGEESFKYKDYLIRNAKKSVYVTTWAFYDDITGQDALEMLVEKKKQGLDVRVIADAKIINAHGISIVPKMEKAGIEVLRFKEKERSADIWHVKMIIVDEKYLIMGGMNFGDVYSHKDANGLKWRDTDVLIMGPAVSGGLDFFKSVWNGEISRNSLKLSKIEKNFTPGEAQGNASVSFSYSNPPVKEGTEILASIIKAIRGSTGKINIENAYFVPIPAVTTALLEALDRGVEVNIFTNSKDSIDAEAKSVSDISMKSMLPLYRAGANIYLKKGHTLHSKFMTIDGIFTSIGSYNIHPRGERYDSELNANILDIESTNSLDKAFKNDIETAAVKVTAEKQLVPDQSWFSSIIEKYFFAHLSRK